MFFESKDGLQIIEASLLFPTTTRSCVHIRLKPTSTHVFANFGYRRDSAVFLPTNSKHDYTSALLQLLPTYASLRPTNLEHHYAGELTSPLFYFLPKLVGTRDGKDLGFGSQDLGLRTSGPETSYGRRPLLGPVSFLSLFSASIVTFLCVQWSQTDRCTQQVTLYIRLVGTRDLWSL